MLKLDEKYLIVAYTFPALIFFAIIYPYISSIYFLISGRNVDLSPFNNTLLDGILALVVCVFFGMVIATIKNTIHDYNGKSIYSDHEGIFTKFIFQTSKNKELEKYKSKFRLSDVKIDTKFGYKAYLLMLRSDYKILMLVNVLLMLNAISNLIVALELSVIFLVVFAIVLVDVSLVDIVMLIVVSDILLRWVRKNYKGIFQHGLCDALEDFFEFKNS